MSITRTASATQAHLKHVQADPDFIKEFNNLKPRTSESVDALYRRYGIEIGDLSDSSIRLMSLLEPYAVFSAGRLVYNFDSQEFTANFRENIRKDEFMELWKLVQKNKIKQGIPSTKNKPPQEDDLLYAIFKARVAYRTFKEIFNDYLHNKLLYYEGKSNAQFHGEDELEKYYRRFYKSKL